MSQMQCSLEASPFMSAANKGSEVVSAVISSQLHTFWTISAKMAEQLHMSTAGA